MMCSQRSGWNWTRASQPLENVACMGIRWMDRIDRRGDRTVFEDERQALQKNLIARLKGRQIEGAGKLKTGIAQERKREMEPVRQLALPGRLLRAQPVHGN